MLDIKQFDDNCMSIEALVQIMVKMNTKLHHLEVVSNHLVDSYDLFINSIIDNALQKN